MAYVISFDFESFGPVPVLHGFTQLGAVIGNLSTGKIVSKFSEYANQKNYIKDKECIERFWETHPKRYNETLKKCEESTKGPQEVINMFLNWIDKFVEKKGKSCYLITDCSTYDSGILKTFSLYSTLKIVNKDIPRDIIDTTSFYLGIAGLFMTEDIVDGNSFDLACKKLKLTNFKSSVFHDHNPVNDSIVIFEQFKFINDALLEE